MQRNSFQFEPIGVVKTTQTYKFESPRQSTLSNNSGFIELNTGFNYEQALEDLEGFGKIWIVFVFHHNSNWKPKVQPPRSTRKRGVFSTRSPHRPNPIGMNCVNLVKIEGRKLYIENFDMLDETPVLDIKPYVPYCDAFPNETTGWIPQETTTFAIELSPEAEEQLNWVEQQTKFKLRDFISVQLSEDPFNTERKRVMMLDDGAAVLAFRTWRIYFRLKDETINIDYLRSGYSLEDLESREDKYGDKSIHHNFNRKFEVYT